MIACLLGFFFFFFSGSFVVFFISFGVHFELGVRVAFIFFLFFFHYFIIFLILYPDSGWFIMVGLLGLVPGNLGGWVWLVHMIVRMGIVLIPHRLEQYITV